MSTRRREGACFCGSVRFEVAGEPTAMGLCHCQSCRSWSGAPVHSFTIWPADAVTVTAGEEHVVTFRKTPESISHRQSCLKCGGHLMIRHPSLGVVDVLAGTLQGLAYRPEIHVNYADTVLPMKDGLPKFRDFPESFGGSDVLVPE